MMHIRTIQGLFVMFGMVATVTAGPLAPPLTTTPVAGETTLYSVYNSYTPVGYVDWAVLSQGDYSTSVFKPLIKQAFGCNIIPDGKYLYAYQIESMVDNVEVFTVNVNSASLVEDLGSCHMDLDSLGHNENYFCNLGSTNEPPCEHEFAYQKSIVDTTNVDLSNTCITWRFDGELDCQEESEVLWFISSCCPSYRPVALQDEVPPTPGIGDIPSNQVPAPGAVLLGMIGLGMVNFFKRTFS